MPATNKTDLLDITAKEHAKLYKLVETLPGETAMKKRDEDTSIKDVIAHRAHWIALFLGWYWDGQAGKKVSFPAEGYKWNELKRYNADLRAKQANVGWADAVALLDDAHRRLQEFLNARTNAELYGGPMKGAQNAWTPGRWAEAAGASHYRSAAKYLRACLRADEKTKA